MEYSPEQNEEFDREKSPLKEAYLLYDAHTAFELFNLYMEDDQRLMQSQSWNYENPDLNINKAKSILESADPSTLTEDEREWRQEIIWFWYHHAVSCAVWRYKDKEAAQKYAAKALEYQAENSPNKITKLLDLLVNDNLEDAEKWAEDIQEEPEKDTATWLIKEYKDGKFF